MESFIAAWREFFKKKKKLTTDVLSEDIVPFNVDYKPSTLCVCVCVCEQSGSRVGKVVYALLLYQGQFAYFLYGTFGSVWRCFCLAELDRGNGRSVMLPNSLQCRGHPLTTKNYLSSHVSTLLRNPSWGKVIPLMALCFSGQFYID